VYLMILKSGFMRRFHALADNPLMGRLRPEIAPELRYFTVGKYLILYRTVLDGVQIVRIIHGARDLPIYSDCGYLSDKSTL
jgi:plasmid stabilization system protein ParE